MSYTVFALKWRPKNFDEIIGQPHIVSTLKNAIQKGRLANAYLFAGPRGVGKTSTARILAKALNCKTGPSQEPCNACSSCNEISQGRSLDVIEIDGASNRGIDEIRVLRENVKFSPTSGKFKIYIIDEVHMLTTEAFNALLKTLEEPPEFVKFIFATTHPNKVIPTILSRCQRFDFRRISALEITAQLERIVSSENISIDKEVLFAIAKASDGSLRDAESVLDQLASFSKEKISLKDVISVLGIVEQDALLQITDKIIWKDAPGALALLNSIIDDGKDMGAFALNLIEHFRNLMIAKVTKGDVKLIDLPVDVCDMLVKQSQELSLEEIFSAFNILVNTLELSKRLESLRIPLEISLVKLAHSKRGQDTVVNTQHSHIPGKSVPVKDTPLKDKPQATEYNKSVSLEDIKNSWVSIINGLEKVKMSVATYLNEGEPVRVENNVLTISFPNNYSLHKESLEGRENKSLIEKSISGILKANIRLQFILSAENQQKDSARNDAVVKTALDMFGARVIKEE